MSPSVCVARFSRILTESLSPQSGFRSARLLLVACFVAPQIAVSQVPNNGLVDFGVYATGTGCGAISISGNASIDSFDSSQGSYTQTKQASKGIVGVSGNITLSGNVAIDGPVFALNTTVGSCSNGKPAVFGAGPDFW